MKSRLLEVFGFPIENNSKKAKNYREHKTYQLVKRKTVYTKFQKAIDTITKPKPGDIEKFKQKLQEKIDKEEKNEPQNGKEELYFKER